MTYQRIDLTGPTSIGSPGPLPPELQGLADESLADISNAIRPAPVGLVGVGFWPSTVTIPTIDPRSQALDEGFDVTIDAAAKTAAATRRSRPLTEAEIAALPPLPEPRPAVLGKLEFIGLAQSAGGMSDAMLVAAYKDPALEAFWVKYQMASEVERDHAVTTQALDALAALGFLPNGAQAVIAAWPSS